MTSPYYQVAENRTDTQPVERDPETSQDPDPPTDYNVPGSPAIPEYPQPKHPDQSIRRGCVSDPQDLTQVRCGNDELCTWLCNSIFETSDHKEACYNYSSENVYYMKPLLKEAEDGVLEDDFLLGCLLDIDDKPIIKAFNTLHYKEAKEVLINITEDDILAEIFVVGDTNYNILRTLLYKATETNVFPDSFTKGINEDRGFIHLASEGGEDVWSWLEGYVTLRSDSYSAIYEYCSAILKMSEPLIEYLINGDNFMDAYRNIIEDESKNRKYDVAETKAYCSKLLKRGLIYEERMKGLLRASKYIYPDSPTCTQESQEKRNSECYDQCYEIYPRSTSRKLCMNFPVQQIAMIEEIHHLLESPRQTVPSAKPDIGTYFSEFQNQHHLKVYLGISNYPYQNSARKYSVREAKEILNWISNNPEIAKVYRTTVRDYYILDTLLNRLTSVLPDEDIYKPFMTVNVSVDRTERKSLLQMALEQHNGEAVDWWIKYILKTNIHCNETAENDGRDPNDLKCFRVFCQIGKALSDTYYRRDLLMYDAFSNYIENVVIKHKVNEVTAYLGFHPSLRWIYGPLSNEFESVMDVDDFYTDLCKNQIPPSYHYSD